MTLDTNTLLLAVEAMTFVSGGIGIYVGLKSEVTKLKSRIYVLEQSETKVQQTLETLVEGIKRIELLLAKKGIE